MKKGYRNYKDNGVGKGVLIGILSLVLGVGLFASGFAVANSIEDNQTQEVENENETETDVETDVDVETGSEVEAGE